MPHDDDHSTTPAFQRYKKLRLEAIEAETPTMEPKHGHWEEIPVQEVSMLGSMLVLCTVLETAT